MTAITEIQRSGAKAARGLVSIQSRYNQILDDTSSTGQKLIAFYDEHSIQLFDQEGQLRSLWETLSDVAEIWDTLDENEQKYFLNIQAGANQSVQLGALMGNFQTAIEATETALNSAGSAMRENESYMQSLNARTDLLKSTFQTLANDVIPKELIAKGLDVLDKFLKLLDTDLGVVLTRITMLTGIGWGFSSLASASKILPTVISQFSNFAKLLSGAAITIPKSAAKIGGLTKAMAVFHSVSLPVIAVLTALGVGIYSLWQRAKDTVSPIDQLSGSLIQLNQTLDSSEQAIDKTKTTVEATSNVAEQYIQRLEELDKQSSLTSQEQQEYHSILENLKSTIPSVSGLIDTQTNSIIGGTKALREQIQAWKELSIQQAYQDRLTEAYKKYADAQIEYEQRKLELQEVQTQRSEAENLLTQAVAKRNQLLAALDATTNKAERQTIGAQIGYYQNIIDEQQKLFMSLGAEKIPYTQALSEFEAGLESAKEEIDKTEKAILSLTSSFASVTPEKVEEAIEETVDETVVGGGTGVGGGGSVTSATTEEKKQSARDIINSYLDSSEIYIDLLESQYELLTLQGASEEDILAKIKEIQDNRHKEAEILRVILNNAESLSLTTDDIYEIETQINECSIDWWNWQNKINNLLKDAETSTENIEENVDDIYKRFEEGIAKLREEERERAANYKDDETYQYWNLQIQLIDEYIAQLQKSNEQLNEQLKLQEKLDNLARAKESRLLVYKDGSYQYIEDVDAVSKAARELSDVQREQALAKTIEDLEYTKSAYQAMVGAVEEGMMGFPSWANTYLRKLDRQGGWQEVFGYAGGTTNASGGLSLVGEKGAELRILNKGDGILPSNLTENLMRWGQMTPNQFKSNSIGGFGNNMAVTIQALNLPNVSNGADFVNYIKNHMFGQVLNLVH